MTQLLVILFIALPCFLLAEHILTQLFIPIADSFPNIEELELVKRYKAIFGLDSDEFDIDATVILEMGRKCESYLGSDKLEEIHTTIMQEKINHCFSINPESRGIHHQINMVIRTHGLVAVPSSITVFTKFNGGDKDGEPSISSHTAA